MKSIFNKCFLLIVFLLPALNSIFADGINSRINLAGKWFYRLDPADVGISNRWFETSLRDTIFLPGSLPQNGIGDDITTETKWTGGIVDKSWFTDSRYERYRIPGNIKVPFWLQPDKYYAGAAWYQREIVIPAGRSEYQWILFLERPHWETMVWVDSKFIGSNNSLSTPHEYNLGHIEPGKHLVTIRVDNRMIIDIGENSHSISDHTQGNWNGVVGRLELIPKPRVFISDLQVYPMAFSKSAKIVVQIESLVDKPVEIRISTRVSSYKNVEKTRTPFQTRDITIKNPGVNKEVFDFEFGQDVKLWDEFSPELYKAMAECAIKLDGREYIDTKEAVFGFREIGTQGTQFTINGRKTFIRGTLECCIFPKTGHPPTDVGSWKRIINTAKAFGLNNIRFHSWCPPEAAFLAADELGMYLHVECSSWANQSTTLGDGKPVDNWVYMEADRILKYYGNHPSFVFMLYGNEPGGKNHEKYLAKWVNYYKSKDPRRLYSSGAGWPQIPENQFHVTPDPRIQAWGAGLKSRINSRPPETVTDYSDYISARSVPVISHEIGQWCVYPNFDEMPKYTGYLKPKNFEIFYDFLKEHHLEHLSRAFLFASGKLQALCYKEDIESALRTPGMGGFQLLDLHDFPGQGTALVGVLDPFWEEKGYINAKEYSRFCNYLVPLARLKKRVFKNDELFDAQVEIANFGPSVLEKSSINWSLYSIDKKQISMGHFDITNIPVRNGLKVGGVQVSLAKFRAPTKCVFEVEVSGQYRTDGKPTKRLKFSNSWDIWVYPAVLPISTESEIRIFNDVGSELVDALKNGKSALLFIEPKRVKKDEKFGEIALGFSPIFWNTAWTMNQAPHTLGILCNPADPVFSEFPTESYSNWQWWYIVTRSAPMILSGFPSTMEPKIRVIDDWFKARSLALLFEAKVLSGKLLVCSIDLRGDLQDNPVARQLYFSIIKYMKSKAFSPKTQLSMEQIKNLMD